MNFIQYDKESDDYTKSTCIKECYIQLTVNILCTIPIKATIFKTALIQIFAIKE